MPGIDAVAGQVMVPQCPQMAGVIFLLKRAGVLRKAAAGRPRTEAACFLITDQVSGMTVAGSTTPMVCQMPLAVLSSDPPGCLITDQVSGMTVAGSTTPMVCQMPLAVLSSDPPGCLVSGLDCSGQALHFRVILPKRGYGTARSLGACRTCFLESVGLALQITQPALYIHVFDTACRLLNFHGTPAVSRRHIRK